MKCPVCDGLGFFPSSNIAATICSQCKGTGEVEQTNEEWFCELSTEEKAEWLDKVAENCCQICDEENRELCRGNIATGCKFENAKKWELWLKQPHEQRGD